MPLTPEQKQAITTLAGVEKADHAEFANELRGTAKPLYQIVFDSGFSSAEGRYRPRAEAAEARAAEAESKVPQGEGVVVLKGDEAKEHQEFKALGLKPADLKTKLTEGEQAAKTLAENAKRETGRELASLAGFKNPDAFIALPGALDLEYERRTEKVDGKDKERVFVKVDGTVKPLDAAFIQSRPEWKPLAAALDVAPGGAPAQQPGAPWVPQPAGEEPKERTADDHRKAVSDVVDYHAI